MHANCKCGGNERTVPRVRVSVVVAFLVLYVEFGKARVGNCAELLGCVVGNCAELLGRCLELHSLICAFECLEMHSCSVWKCNACLVLYIS